MCSSKVAKTVAHDGAPWHDKYPAIKYNKWNPNQHILCSIKWFEHRNNNYVFYRISQILPPGSGIMEKRRQHKIAIPIDIMAILLCASILCAVVLLITNALIRHAVEWMIAVAIWVQPSASMANTVDFCGGLFSRRSFCELPADSRSGPYFAADFVIELCGGLSADLAQAQNHVNYISKSPRFLHRKSTAFFTACLP